MVLNLKKLNNTQEGVTLLLSLLVLSAVLAISFSLSTILFTEVRNSGDLLRSEGSLYGATGVGEEALFNLKRQVCANNDSGCLSSKYPAQFNNNVTLTGLPTVSSFSNPIFQDKVPAYTSFANTGNKYDFCNVTSGSSGCGYGKVTVNYISTGNDQNSLFAYLCEWDPTGNTTYLTSPCTTVSTTGQVQTYWKQPDTGNWQTDGSTQLTPSTNASASWTITDSTKQQMLILTAPSAGANVFFSVQTFAPDGITPKGLPFVGKTAVVINASNGALGRKIQVVVPNISSSSGSVLNVSQGKTATQSSTFDGSTVANNALDGNTDGNYSNGSITHTLFNTNAWWQVDLGSSFAVSSIGIWNRTDCCSNRLSDYWIFVSDTPFGPSDTPANLQSRAGTWGSHQTSMPNPSTTIAASGATGRYVRVQLTGSDYLSMAELQVFGGSASPPPSTNVALNQSATQSSTLSGYGPQTAAASAVDGNTDGNFSNASVTHTNSDVNAWWQVDLGVSRTVTSVNIWNRTDCCSNRLTDYWVFVSDTPFAANDTPATLQGRAGTWNNHQTSFPNPSTTIAAVAQGRYVRVQLSGTDYLSLAEVQVMGY